MNADPAAGCGIWVLGEQRSGALEEAVFGLLGEARRLLSSLGAGGDVTVVTVGALPADELKRLGACGAERVLCLEGEPPLSRRAEAVARVVAALAGRERPACFLAARTPWSADLCPRVAALLETAFVNCAVDLGPDGAGGFLVTRPVCNGYLFEEVRTVGQGPPVISFLPSVLAAPPPDPSRRRGVKIETAAFEGEESRTRFLGVLEADPGRLDLEDAEIIVAGGRGAGKGEAFRVIHDLARALGGAVAGTRPVVDWETLPHEKQIGQTGKSVAPRLIVNCGISGANEYTAGMETSQLVIAVNTDPRARIFRFADLGVVGDLHRVLPLLLERIEKRKEPV